MSLCGLFPHRQRQVNKSPGYVILAGEGDIAYLVCPPNPGAGGLERDRRRDRLGDGRERERLRHVGHDAAGDDLAAERWYDGDAGPESEPPAKPKPISISVVMIATTTITVTTRRARRRIPVARAAATSAGDTVLPPAV